MRALIVGAGMGGRATACHLAGRGHEVTLVERIAAEHAERTNAARRYPTR